MTTQLMTHSLSPALGPALGSAPASAAIAREPAVDALAQLRARLATCSTATPASRGELLRSLLSEFANTMPMDELRELLPAPSANGYQRHVLAADPNGEYCAVAIIWSPRQFSPVHAHHTWCAYTVLEGALMETHYDWCAEQHGAQPAGQRLCARNTVSYTDAGYSGIHCLGNATTIPAVSLHVYGVDETQIATAVNHLLPVLTT
jgi:predicted metal-dependent enzyme (double-stranded beta helix superfamily)